MFFFKVKNEKPLKKNSSRIEFAKEIYIATNIKLSLLTPVVDVKVEVSEEKSKMFLNKKYAVIITK